MDSLLKCRDCGEDCLPQEIRGARPADASSITADDAWKGFGPHAVAARQNGLSHLVGDGLSRRQVLVRLWLLRATFIAAGFLVAWIAIFGI